jgi:hypothetical protein
LAEPKPWTVEFSSATSINPATLEISCEEERYPAEPKPWTVEVRLAVEMMPVTEKLFARIPAVVETNDRVLT